MLFQKVSGYSRRNLHNKSKTYQYQYAAQILLISAITAAKISLSILIQSLLSEGRGLIAGRSLLVVIIGWGVTSIFALAFGCALPEPWDTTGHCVNLVRRVMQSHQLHLTILACSARCHRGYEYRHRCTTHGASMYSLLECARQNETIKSCCPIFIKNHVRLLFQRKFRHHTNFKSVCVATGLQLRYFERYISSDDQTCKSE